MKDCCTELVRLDLILGGNEKWDTCIDELFSTYGVDSFEDLVFFISDEEFFELSTLGNILIVSN